MSVNLNSTLKILQKFSEKSFTIEILVPLFYAFGFEKVDYHGGPYEEGKDLIFWRYDELGLVELAVAQIKKYKPSAKASDNKSFMEIINQLQCAFENPVPHLDGKNYLPSIVYLITPFPIETRALKTRFEKYSFLRTQRLKIIDGPLLINLIKQHLPDLASSFLGIQESIHKVSTNKLNNQTLLNALDFKSEKNIAFFYSDLDITFGNISANLFFSLIPAQKYFCFKLTEPEWDKFEGICQLAVDSYDFSLITNSVNQINKSFADEKKAHIAAFKSSSTEDKRDKSKAVTVDIEINLDSITLFFESKKSWLSQQISILNDASTPLDKCRSVLKDCHKLFSFMDLLLHDRNISTIFKSFKLKKDCKKKDSITRIKIPINKLVNTGLHFAILGEAGAGKTTCLQMQAMHILSETRSKDAVLFLPLAPIVSNYRKNIRYSEELSAIEHLKTAIIEYYRLERIQISPNNLDDTLENSKSLLLFDGIDEVMSLATWILDAIESMAKRYPNSQVICSARTGGKYLSDISFLGINLLPFTDQQRVSFFSNWFDSPDDKRVKKIITHLEEHPNLAEIVRSPLLSTILCVLTEHGVELPESEIRLYQERMRLLLGHYDIHKQTVRISSTQYLLSTIARKLPFSFHQHKLREMEFDMLIKSAIQYAPKGTDEQDILIAVNELIHPCNILVPMSHRKNFGFGHFRYQEYLAALELVQNRGVDIGPYLYQDWWRGCLVLFAQLTDDIEFLITKAFDSKTATESKPTIDAILDVRSYEEKEKYLTKIDKAILDEEYIRSISSRR